MRGVIKGDTRSLDYMSHARRYKLGQTEVDASVNLAASVRSSTEGGSFPGVRVCIWRFPKIRGILLGVPNNKIYSILGVYIGVLNFGKLPYLRLVLVVLFPIGAPNREDSMMINLSSPETGTV